MKGWRKRSFHPKVGLELLNPHAVRTRIGAMSLAVAIMAAAAVVTYHLQLQKKIATLEERLSVPPPEANRSVDPEETAAVQAALEHLGFSWGRLFAGIEAAAMDEIRLVSVEPDAEKGTVKLIAEAPEEYLMLEYARSLAKQPALQNVMLGGYEVVEGKTDQPVRFTLSAAWKNKP